VTSVLRVLATGTHSYPVTSQQSTFTLTSGIRGGGAGGGATTPLSEKFRANSVFRASASCSKFLKDKKYFNTVKIFRATSVFQGKRKLFKILNDKQYILNTVNSGHTLFFRANTRCSKILKCKNYIHNSEKFQGRFCFQGKR